MHVWVRPKPHFHKEHGPRFPPSPHISYTMDCPAVLKGRDAASGCYGQWVGHDTGQSSTSGRNSWHTFSPRYVLVQIFWFYITITLQVCCALQYCPCLVNWLPASTPTGWPAHSFSGSNFPHYAGRPRVQWKNQHLIIWKMEGPAPSKTEISYVSMKLHSATSHEIIIVQCRGL